MEGLWTALLLLQAQCLLQQRWEWGPCPAVSRPPFLPPPPRVGGRTLTPRRQLCPNPRLGAGVGMAWGCWSDVGGLLGFVLWDWAQFKGGWGRAGRALGAQ